jgi:hypothetical protein
LISKRQKYWLYHKLSFPLLPLAPKVFASQKRFSATPTRFFRGIQILNLLTVKRLPLLLFCLLPAGVFAGGGAEDPEKASPQNTEWILCVTNFDISALPPNRRVIGEVMTRRLVDTINAVDHRMRISREYAYYEEYAWSQARLTAAKALAAKRDERDLLLYRGEPEWRYRRSLKTIDNDIKKLEETLVKTEAQLPLIDKEPVFKFTEENMAGTFPAPPKAGGEYRFCQTQKADAFLEGTVTEFHGRVYITLRLYTLYTRSFIYEDNIIFSADDAGGAVDEIAGRLIAVLAGSSPAAIAVNVEPPDAMVLINKTFAGRGTVAAQAHPPGKVTVSLSAENYSLQTVETDLAAGELTEIEAVLRPLDMTGVTITVPGKTGVSVYRGAMYVGEAPLTLRLPVNQFDYVNLETAAQETASAVFLTPALFNQNDILSLKTKASRPSGQKRVENARRRYYWSWGGTWIAGAAAWMINGVFTAYRSAYQSPDNPNPTREMYDQTMDLYYINLGGMALVGVAVAHEIFQMVRYLYVSGQDAAPIVKSTTPPLPAEELNRPKDFPAGRQTLGS